MATIGYGAKLKIGTAFVAEAAMITLPSFEVAEVESTHLGVVNRTRTWIPGLTDGGTFSFECNYTAAEFSTLFGLLGTDSDFIIYSPESELQMLEFGGFIKKGPDVSWEPNAVSKMKCEVKVTSAVTVSAYTLPLT